MASDGPQLLIVGAGPTGLATALELARAGIRPRIIDAEASRPHHSKAIGINARTLELLEPTLVSERLLARGLKVLGVALHANNQDLGRIEFARLNHRYNFMLALPQSDTESILEGRLLEFGCHVERNQRFIGLSEDKDGIAAVIESNGVTNSEIVQLLVGADGAHSGVRQALGVDFPGEPMDVPWSLADVELDQPWDPRYVHLVFQRDAVLFMLRFAEDRYRIAASTPDLLSRLPPYIRVNQVLWESAFAVNHRQVVDYAVGRTFLAGDAAHVHSPLGARGMNLGIEDGTTLGRYFVQGKLHRYHDNRHRAGASTIRFVKRQTRLTTTNTLIARMLKTRIFPAILRSGPIQRNLVRTMLGLASPNI